MHSGLISTVLPISPPSGAIQSHACATSASIGERELAPRQHVKAAMWSNVFMQPTLSSAPPVLVGESIPRREVGERREATFSGTSGLWMAAGMGEAVGYSTGRVTVRQSCSMLGSWVVGCCDALSGQEPANYIDLPSCYPNKPPNMGITTSMSGSVVPPK
ncbi:hypothetical protein F5Y17DRAFT_108361 [Xylariaceae sp. FL0594]|nr:hypothetical protein F5Y17DRAFT_108361 [Xylariaceae sp. FL0594]